MDGEISSIIIIINITNLNATATLLFIDLHAAHGRGQDGPGRVGER